LGWEAEFVAEIEPFPSAVLAHHYPNVPNLGDMTKYEDWNVGQIDALVGGTPCQAFSVAGLRGGLSDARGNLSLVFCRMADHFDPEWVIWENVPGVLSSTDNAFGCFLAGLCGASEPLSPGRKWSNAGVVSGPKRTVAWRVLDAQFFGVAQRRRRVFVLAVRGSGNWAAARALFPVGEGMFWNSAPSRKAREGAARGAQAGAAVSSGHGVDFQNSALTGSVSGTLDAEGQKRGNRGHGVLSFGGNRTSGAIDVAACLLPPVRGWKGDFERETFVAHTLEATAGRSRGAGTPVGMLATAVRTANTSANGHGISEGLAHTLDQAQGQCVAVTFRADAMREGSAKTPSPDAEGRVRLRDPGMGMYIDIAPTIDCGAAHGVAHAFDARQSDVLQYGNMTGPIDTCGHSVAVAVALRGREGGATVELGDEVSNCLRASSGGGDKAHVLATGWSEELNALEDVQPTIQRGGDGGRHDGVMTPAMQVRRLTPRECERLQGFPEIAERVILTICTDPQNHCATVALKCLRWHVSASGAGSGEFPLFASTAEVDSTISQAGQGVLAALYVQPQSDGSEAQISSLARSDSSASGASGQGLSRHQTLDATTAHSLARTLRELAHSIRTGKVASPLSMLLSTAAQSGAEHALMSGGVTGASVSDALSGQTAGTFTTSELGRLAPVSGSREATLCCSVMSAIAGSIQGQTLPKIFSLEATVQTPYTLVPNRGKPAADGPRYKALGNSMAVPVMQWIGMRIQMVEQTKEAA
jgi:DNA (cytosine-5)-methyltransferase 1